MVAGARTEWDAIRLGAKDQEDGVGGTGPRKKWIKKEVRMDELFRGFFRVRNGRIIFEGGGRGWRKNLRIDADVDEILMIRCICIVRRC